MVDKHETVFVAKTVKVKNSKAKDYFLYRMTIPKAVAEQMELGSQDHLLIKAKKASWFHLLDWSQNDKGWDMLADSAKAEILKLGLPVPTGVIVGPSAYEQPRVTNYSPQLHTAVYGISASSSMVQQKIEEQPLAA